MDQVLGLLEKLAAAGAIVLNVNSVGGVVSDGKTRDLYGRKIAKGNYIHVDVSVALPVAEDEPAS